MSDERRSSRGRGDRGADAHSNGLEAKLRPQRQSRRVHAATRARRRGQSRRWRLHDSLRARAIRPVPVPSAGRGQGGTSPQRAHRAVPGSPPLERAFVVPAPWRCRRQRVSPGTGRPRLLPRLTIVALALLSTACGDASSGPPTSAPAASTPAPPGVDLKPETVSPSYETRVAAIDTTGKVLLNEETLVRVHAPLTGRVLEVI